MRILFFYVIITNVSSWEFLLLDELDELNSIIHIQSRSNVALLLLWLSELDLKLIIVI